MVDKDDNMKRLPGIIPITLSQYVTLYGCYGALSELVYYAPETEIKYTV